jgi:hypothetical protein
VNKLKGKGKNHLHHDDGYSSREGGVEAFERMWVLPFLSGFLLSQEAQ